MPVKRIGRASTAPHPPSASNTLLFVFPMPPNLANSRMHWRVKHSQKLFYWQQCDFGPQSITPNTPPHPIAKARISSVMFLGGKMDTDNAMARHKWILDYLKSRSFIVDDRQENIVWAGFPEQHIDRKNQRIEITLEPIAMIKDALNA